MSSDSDRSKPSPADEGDKSKSGKSRRIIRIGSQRDSPDSSGEAKQVPEKIGVAPSATPPIQSGSSDQSPRVPDSPTTQSISPLAEAPTPLSEEAAGTSAPASTHLVPDDTTSALDSADTDRASDRDIPMGDFPPPRVDRISDELQQEIDAALGDTSMDDLLGGAESSPAKISEPEIDQRYRAAVVKVHRDDVFFSLLGHYEGVASLRQFDEPPEPGTVIEVNVNRFNSDEGLFEVSIPGASTQVQDWSDLDEGVTVTAVITAHNSGGLECEVNKIRGFIPISQISLYRVEDLEQFVGERFVCVVTEANPARGNLVLSRRAMLEREKSAAKEKLMKTLQEGQEHEGIVRKIMDFGAFVDLGGVDGLVHISKLSWDRVQHPSDVVEEGQKIKVVIEKIDTETGRIGLSLRDTIAHPWEDAKSKYVENSVATGTVSKIMDFGAFVRLEAGIEGLIHISELAHHRVVRVANVVSEGQDVTVKILSVDPDAQRMSLSMKAIQAPPEATQSNKADDEADEPPRESAVKKKHQGSLRGGTNRKTGGEQFGLNW